MEFSRQEHWSGLPFPPPGDLPDPGIKPTSPTSPTLAGRFLALKHQSSFNYCWWISLSNVEHTPPHTWGGVLVMTEPFLHLSGSQVTQWVMTCDVAECFSSTSCHISQHPLLLSTCLLQPLCGSSIFSLAARSSIITDCNHHYFCFENSSFVILNLLQTG